MIQNKDNDFKNDSEGEQLSENNLEKDLGNSETETESEDVEFAELNSEGEELSDNQKEKLEKKYLEKISRLEKERDEYLAGWQRVQADYKNREKEIENFKKDFINFANLNLIQEILPALDSFEMAKSKKEIWEKVDNNWRTGIEYIFSQLISVLANHGLKTFGEIGEKYNPVFHETIEVINLDLAEKESHDKIVNVIQTGYKIGERILRAARVKVGKFEE